MDIARAIVKGIGVNIYEVLYHYYKHDKKEVKENIDGLKKYFFQVNSLRILSDYWHVREKCGYVFIMILNIFCQKIL